MMSLSIYILYIIFAFVFEFEFEYKIDIIYNIPWYNTVYYIPHTKPRE